ncbi:hypothetical protein FNV43_RR17655 [Rhamnella rubrinervis]|uniref:Uncharacterized protein n=1 Tax=Rhamnella rubrinervis TaxID=2594499 RepID=A0A8K0GVV9_9ROSA|nr:hypothetical protein FNV43_RR17655 [Rhamnella rubrinervis]
MVDNASHNFIKEEARGGSKFGRVRRKDREYRARAFRWYGRDVELHLAMARQFNAIPFLATTGDEGSENTREIGRDMGKSSRGQRRHTISYQRVSPSGEVDHKLKEQVQMRYFRRSWRGQLASTSELQWEMFGRIWSMMLQWSNINTTIGKAKQHWVKEALSIPSGNALTCQIVDEDADVAWVGRMSRPAFHHTIGGVFLHWDEAWSSSELCNILLSKRGLKVANELVECPFKPIAEINDRKFFGIELILIPKEIWKFTYVAYYQSQNLKLGKSCIRYGFNEQREIVAFRLEMGEIFETKKHIEFPYASKAFDLDK